MRKYKRLSWVLLLIDKTDVSTAFLPLYQTAFWTQGCFICPGSLLASILKISLLYPLGKVLKLNFTFLGRFSFCFHLLKVFFTFLNIA